MDLPVAYVLKMRLVTDAIQANVRTKTGVKTDSVLFLKKSNTVMNAMKNAEKAC